MTRATSEDARTKNVQGIWKLLRLEEDTHGRVNPWMGNYKDKYFKMEQLQTRSHCRMISKSRVSKIYYDFNQLIQNFGCRRMVHKLVLLTY